MNQSILDLIRKAKFVRQCQRMGLNERTAIDAFRMIEVFYPIDSRLSHLNKLLEREFHEQASNHQG
jgi:hypothetical protein